MKLTELVQMKSDKPTKVWRKSLPWTTRLLLFRSYRNIEYSLSRYIDSLARLAPNTDQVSILSIIKATIEELNEIDERGGGGVIETGEREDLCEYIGKSARLAGLDAPADIDITEGFRNW